jgi:hypothetical protein
VTKCVVENEQIALPLNRKLQSTDVTAVAMPARPKIVAPMFARATLPGSVVNETPTAPMSNAKAPLEPDAWNAPDAGVLDTHREINAEAVEHSDTAPIGVAPTDTLITDGGGMLYGPVAPVMTLGDEMWVTTVAVVGSTTALHTDASKLHVTLTTDIPTLVKMFVIE